MKTARKQGLSFKQSYERVGRRLLIGAGPLRPYPTDQAGTGVHPKTAHPPQGRTPIGAQSHQRHPGQCHQCPAQCRCHERPDAPQLLFVPFTPLPAFVVRPGIPGSGFGGDVVRCFFQGRLNRINTTPPLPPQRASKQSNSTYDSNSVDRRYTTDQRHHRDPQNPTHTSGWIHMSSPRSRGPCDVRTANVGAGTPIPRPDQNPAGSGVSPLGKRAKYNQKPGAACVPSRALRFPHAAPPAAAAG